MNIRTTALAAALTLTLALGAAPLSARGHGPGGLSPMGKAHGGMVQRLTRMLHQLDLSDEQREQVRTILEAARPEFRAHMEAIRSARQELRNLDPATFDEAKVRTLARAQADRMVELAVLGQKVRAQVWAVLTPEQREKAAEARARAEERRRRFRECLQGAGAPPAE